MAHAHSHPRPTSGDGDGHIRTLRRVLMLTVAYTVVEIVGGLLSNSLALLADAGHMMTDNFALGLALLAAWFARRPPDPNRTYGYQRAEILAALANGVFLVLVCVYIFFEAWRRLHDPPEVRAGLMGIVAVGGLLVNLAAVWMLHRNRRSLNLRAAFLHVLGDLLGSVGAIGAAVVMVWTGWSWVDPAVSVLIGAIIVISSVRLVLESLNVLMEGVPSNLDSQEIRGALESLPGVESVHDLHIWSLGAGNPLLSAHLVLAPDGAPGPVLREATGMLRDRFGIHHATLQVEPHDFNIVQSPSNP